jgi:hypothetical protein
MTVPTTTPGTLGRVRAWITKTPPSNKRSMTRRLGRGSLLAPLPAIAAAALTGALATAGAQAAAHPDHRSTYKASAGDCAEKRAIFVKTRGRWRCQNLYMARVALDGRKQPDVSKSGAKRNYLKAGEWVNIRCQAYDYDGHTGERLGLYDKVGDVFVPDKYMRTLYTGRIPGAPVCDPQPDGSWRP